MKRLTSVLAFFLLSAALSLPSHANADTPPTADATCSFTNVGAFISANIAFQGGSFTVNGIQYDWEFAILNQGQNPILPTSYGSRLLARTTNPNATLFTYEELLALASGREEATLIFYAMPKLIIGTSTITSDQRGAGCYFTLDQILKYKQNPVANPTQPVPSPTNLTPPLPLADNMDSEPIFISLRAQKSSLEKQISAISRISISISNSLTKIALGGMPRIPEKGENYTQSQAKEIADKFQIFLTNFNQTSSRMIAEFNKQKKNSCIKGAVRITVKSGKKCPTGYNRP